MGDPYPAHNCGIHRISIGFEACTQRTSSVAFSVRLMHMAALGDVRLMLYMTLKSPQTPFCITNLFVQGTAPGAMITWRGLWLAVWVRIRHINTTVTSHRRHGHDVSNRRRLHWFFNGVFWLTPKNTKAPRYWSLTGGFPSQKTSNTKPVSI